MNRCHADFILRKAAQEDCQAICELHIASIRGLGISHYTPGEVEAWARGKTPERYKSLIENDYVIIAEQG